MSDNDSENQLLKNWPKSSFKLKKNSFQINSQDLRDAGPSNLVNLVNDPLSYPITRASKGEKKFEKSTYKIMDAAHEKPKRPCPICGKHYLSINIHISKAHPSAGREKVVKNSRPAESTNPQQSLNTCSIRSKNKGDIQLDAANDKLQEHYKNLIKIAGDVVNYKSFDDEVNSIIKILKEAINILPGPKHPASRFYKMRKAGLEMVSNRNFSQSQNPIRADKKAKQRTRDKYNYELAQFEYTNCRRRLKHKILKPLSNDSCKINVKIVEEHYTDVFQTTNNCSLEQYLENSTTDTQVFEFTEKSVGEAMNGIAIDTAPGPDGIYMRSVKSTKCRNVLAAIGNIMLDWSYVPLVLRKARTVLIHKSGDLNDITNFRPITIFSTVRRILERVIDRYLHGSLSISPMQRGFISIPGTYINTTILSGCLQQSKSQKSSITAVFLDVSKAFDSIGHAHIENTLKSLPIDHKLIMLLIFLLRNNSTHIQVDHNKTKLIRINKGVAQGSPLSPLTFILGIDYLLRELSDDGLLENYGFKINNSVRPISVMAFADDIVILAKGIEEAQILVNSALMLLSKIGLSVNSTKSQIINLKNGKLEEGIIETFTGEKIRSIKKGDRIRYLGVDFEDDIIFDSQKQLENINVALENLTKSPLLKPDQKLNFINQFIWPSLIYPLQCAPLTKIKLAALDSIDLLLRSAVKEILTLPADVPNSMLYSPRKLRGLGLVRARWEAFLQHLNICFKLNAIKDDLLHICKNFNQEISSCLKHLNIEDNSFKSVKVLRSFLRNSEFENWCTLVGKGKGVCLFKEVPKFNKWMSNKSSVSSSEWITLIKMNCNSVSLRAIPGRSPSTTLCRSNCGEHETLAHVLGFCPKGQLLRIQRHNKIRSLIADSFRAQSKFEVYEETHCLSITGCNRRTDIIIIDRRLNSGLILDPTIRFESGAQQPLDVDSEKKQIYEPCFEYLSEKYNVANWKVIGLFIGARGSVSKFLVEFFKSCSIALDIIHRIIEIVLRSSLLIYHYHIFGA